MNDRSEFTSSTAERGQCPVCDRWFLITRKGKVRTHGTMADAGLGMNCRGSGQDPKPEEE